MIDPADPLSESNARPVSDVLVYDIASGVFTQGLNLPEPLEGHAVLLHDGYLYTISGQTEWSDLGRTAKMHRLLVSPQSRLCDLDGDGAAGLPGVIRILQDIAGTR